jgi:cbb3-type cytochrome oxidase subunit 3
LLIAATGAASFIALLVISVCLLTVTYIVEKVHKHRADKQKRYNLIPTYQKAKEGSKRVFGSELSIDLPPPPIELRQIPKFVSIPTIPRTTKLIDPIANNSSTVNVQK